MPQLYVRVKDGDIAGSGALLSGKDVNINLSGDLTNSGTIAGRNVVQINANNINNLGGRVTGETVSADAAQDLNNIGGTIDAGSALFASAGHDLNNITTTNSASNTVGTNSFSHTNIASVAGLYVSGDAGVLAASAGHDANIIAGVISNSGINGQTLITAKYNINLGTVTFRMTEQVMAKCGHPVRVGRNDVTREN